jgi:hypothetical protein
MADPAKSVITLTTGGSIATPETPDDLKRKVLHGSERPFIEVSDLVGGIHLVAVEAIVEIAPSGI